MKYLVEIDEMAGAEDPAASRKMVGDSLELMLGVKSSRLLPASSNDEYLDSPRWTAREQLAEEFIEMVEERVTSIDPARTIDWKSLAIGFALTRELSPECAWSFATYVINYSRFKPPQPPLRKIVYVDLGDFMASRKRDNWLVSWFKRTFF